MQTEIKQERNVSLDVLRIIAIFMILTAHFLGWGGAVNTLTTGDLNYFIVMPIYFFCGIGNTLFFMLAGYFAKRPKASKALFIQRKTCFYSFFISLFLLIFGLNTSIGYTIKSLFPVLFNKYWFVSVYLVLYLLSFVLIPGFEKLTKGQFLLVIGALLVNNTCVFDASYTLLEGLLAYAVGYYLKKFKPQENMKKIWMLLIYFVVMAAYVVERFAMRHFGLEHTRLDEGLRYTLLLLSATALFMFFASVRIRGKWISAIASNILSVYLISAHPALVQVLYTKWLHVEAFCREWWFVGYYFIVNVAIFAICVGIDKLVSYVNRKEVEGIEKLCKRCFSKKEKEVENLDGE